MLEVKIRTFCTPVKNSTHLLVPLFGKSPQVTLSPSTSFLPLFFSVPSPRSPAARPILRRRHRVLLLSIIN